MTELAAWLALALQRRWIGAANFCLARARTCQTVAAKLREGWHEH